MPKQSSTKKSPKHSPKVAHTVEHKKLSAKPKKMPPKTGPAVEQGKTSAKPSKMSSEIDEIFAGKKRKMQEKDTQPNTSMPVRVYVSDVNPHEGLRTVKKVVQSKTSLKENRLAGPSSRQRKKTADGLTVYSEEELGFGKAGAGALQVSMQGGNVGFVEAMNLHHFV